MFRFRTCCFVLQLCGNLRFFDSFREIALRMVRRVVQFGTLGIGRAVVASDRDTVNIHIIYQLHGDEAHRHIGCEGKGRPPMEPVMREMDEQVARYEAELVRLRTENDQLRRSAQAFGELAERLNRALLIATAARHAQATMGTAPVQRRLRTGSND